MSWHWLDNRIVQGDQSSVPISRGLWYGDGCFETLLIDAGKLFRFDAHIDRLKDGMSYLGFPDPPDIKDRILSGISELLQAGGLHEKKVRVRIQVWREGRGGFAPPDDQNIRLHIMALEISGENYPLRLATVPTRRIPTVSVRSDLKLSSSANYIRAAYEARKLKADEALMLTVDDFISETTIANVFWLTGNTIYTPSIDCDLLPGIMREAFIEWVRNHQNEFRLEEGKFTTSNLGNAEAMWLTNSVRLIQPVTSVDQYHLEKNISGLENIEDNFRLFIAERYTTIG